MNGYGLTETPHVGVLCTLVGEADTCEYLSQLVCEMYNGKTIGSTDIGDGKIQIQVALKPKRRVRFQLLSS